MIIHTPIISIDCQPADQAVVKELLESSKGTRYDDDDTIQGAVKTIITSCTLNPSLINLELVEIPQDRPMWYGREDLWRRWGARVSGETAFRDLDVQADNPTVSKLNTILVLVQLGCKRGPLEYPKPSPSQYRRRTLYDAVQTVGLIQDAVMNEIPDTITATVIRLILPLARLHSAQSSVLIKPFGSIESNGKTEEVEALIIQEANLVGDATTKACIQRLVPQLVVVTADRICEFSPPLAATHIEEEAEWTDGAKRVGYGLIEIALYQQRKRKSVEQMLAGEITGGGVVGIELYEEIKAKACKLSERALEVVGAKGERHICCLGDECFADASGG